VGEVGDILGLGVGFEVGARVGTAEGSEVGTNVGADGTTVGLYDGVEVGNLVGNIVGGAFALLDIALKRAAATVEVGPDNTNSRDTGTLAGVDVGRHVDNPEPAVNVMVLVSRQGSTQVSPGLPGARENRFSL